MVQNYSDLDSIEFKKVRDFTSLLKWNFSLFQSIESVYSPAAIFIISGKTLVSSVLGSCNSLLEIPRLVTAGRANPL